MKHSNIPKIALIYDFDETLSARSMQEYGFMEELGLDAKTFWHKTNKMAEDLSMDANLAYMLAMIKACKSKNIPLTKEFLNRCGKQIEFLPGVESWFERINNFGKSQGVEIEHYIVSSGLKEMIEGSKIAKEFKEIYACYFVYENGNAIWPGLCVNYTGKTQYLYRINKGILNVTDNSLNENMPQELRPVPFTNMIYIGDSATDIPCMRLVMKSGGYAIGVYQNDKKHITYLKNLISQNKINQIAKADYNADGELDFIVKEFIAKIKHTENLNKISEAKKISLAKK